MAVGMAMVDVRVMRVLVRQHFMPVRMYVRLISIPGEVVRVLVMLVVTMTVRVLQRFMRVFVFVPLAHMQPDP